MTVHRFAVLTAAVALGLIVAGAFVTSSDAGDSIPSWPGPLMPQWIGGIRIEFTHRIIAAFTALLITLLAIWLWRTEKRRWVRWLGAGALIGVLLQALLGGLRVLVISDEQVKSTALAVTGASHVEPVRIGIAVTHAALAQIVLCLTVVLSAVTSPAWLCLSPSVPSGKGRRHWSLVIGHWSLVVAVFFQLLLGALMRHAKAGLILPHFPSFAPEPYEPNAPFPMSYAEWQFKVGVHSAHRVLAFLIAGLVVWMTVHILRRHRHEPRLVKLAFLLLALTLTQITLGALVIWTELSIHATVAHVAVGASLLATVVLVALWSGRHRFASEELQTKPEIELSVGEQVGVVS